MTTDTAITYEAAQRAGACAEGLSWLAEHGPVDLPDIPRPDWRTWAIRYMPDHARPHLTRLSEDSDCPVRAAVAEHPDAGPLLARLAEDADYWVCRVAHRRLVPRGE